MAIIQSLWTRTRLSNPSLHFHLPCLSTVTSEADRFYQDASGLLSSPKRRNQSPRRAFTAKIRARNGTHLLDRRHMLTSKPDPALRTAHPQRLKAHVRVLQPNLKVAVGAAASQLIEAPGGSERGAWRAARVGGVEARQARDVRREEGGQEGELGGGRAAVHRGRDVRRRRAERVEQQCGVGVRRREGCQVVRFLRPGVRVGGARVRRRHPVRVARVWVRGAAGAGGGGSGGGAPEGAWERQVHFF